MTFSMSDWFNFTQQFLRRPVYFEACFQGLFECSYLLRIWPSSVPHVALSVRSSFYMVAAVNSNIPISFLWVMRAFCLLHVKTTIKVYGPSNCNMFCILLHLSLSPGWRFADLAITHFNKVNLSVSMFIKLVWLLLHLAFNTFLSASFTEVLWHIPALKCLLP